MVDYWQVREVEATADPGVVEVHLSHRHRLRGKLPGGIEVTEELVVLVQTEDAPRVYDEYNVIVERIEDE